MLIPSFLHGITRNVKAETRRRVRRLGKGASWSEAFEDDLVDAASLSGLLVLHGPAPVLGGKPHVHVYLPLLEAFNAIERKGGLDPALEPVIYDAALQSAWGTLCALGPANLVWVIPPVRHRPLVEATLRYWDELDAQGPRYSNGGQTGKRLRECSPTVMYALAQLGVPKERLRAITSENLPEVARSVL